MDWGTRIVVGMGIAMTTVVATGVYMVSQDKDSLEDIDYYENSLNYDDDYQQKELMVQAHATPKLSIEGDSLYITFSTTGNEGRIYFKRPSDKNLDMTLPFLVADQRYSLPLHALQPGAWQIRINWKTGQQDFLYENDLFIPVD